ncbi:MAG TPA: helix-turn-helix transcriptional regulator [Desulfosporosinus sp.]|nr:helix-turn-helix transcriptional regulator [Desulfosporosinus sp.]
MEWTDRQQRIVKIVKDSECITGEKIAAKLGLTRATLRPDLTILTMFGVLEAKPRVGYSYLENTRPSPIMERLLQLRVCSNKSMPVTVLENASIYEATVAMFTQNVGSLTVVGTDRHLLGMISRKDIMKASLGKIDLQQVPVGVIMTRMPNIYMTTLDEPVYSAAKKLVQHAVDSLPVVEQYVDENGDECYEVVGRFTKTNVTKLFVEFADARL